MEEVSKIKERYGTKQKKCLGEFNYYELYRAHSKLEKLIYNSQGAE